MTLFPPDRSLLYPQFETYRLHPLDPTDDVLSYPLPGPGATQSRLEHGQHNLSFKEVRARIGWDHLAMDDEGRGVYVDKEWNVIGFTFGEDLIPHFSSLAVLPQPISSASSSSRTPAPEYPSVLPLSSGLWAVGSGSGSLYILQTSSDNSSGEFIAQYHLDSPFLLRSSHFINETDTRLLLSRSVSDASAGKKRHTSTSFDLLEISVDPSHRSDPDTPIDNVNVRWVLRGGDLPVHCTWTDEGWMVLSGETFGPIEPDQNGGETEGDKAQKDRDERIGKLGLGASLPAGEAVPEVIPEHSKEETLPLPSGQPFTWKQTGDTASISIPFAAGTKRSDITIDLQPSSISLSLKSGPEQPESLRQFLRYPEYTWWAEIDLSLSSYSFDPSTSILDIDLQKINTNYRWPSLFLPSDDDDDLSDIPETLDASTLAAVRDSFNNIRTRGPDEPEGNHPAIPSLLREEMDFDMDGNEGGEGEMEGDSGGKVGRDIYVGMIKDGQAKWSKTTNTVISLPFQPERSGAGVMIKSAVDGILFSPPVSGDATKSTWEHQATTPALAFVLSSKRDIRLVRHLVPSPDPSQPPPPKKIKTASSSDISASSTQHPTVLAFDSGSSSNGQGNVYVYYPPTSRTTAKQGVVRVSGAERGAMLGVSVVRKGGKDVVVVLCEKELVLLVNVVM